jgi:DNA repair exonuclease SbcCD ATPase subunit
MMQKRTEHDEESLERGELAAMETARSASESSGEKNAEPKKDEEHVSIFWRLFGGTILSIVALVSITLYNNISSSITDLRAEVSREREARAELVKKDEYNSRVTSIYERMRGIDSLKVELEGQKEKISTSSTAVDVVKKDTNATIEAMKKDTGAAIDALKKDAASLDVLKERVAALETVKKDIAALDALKEKLTATAADLKAMRDDLAKVSANVERNKASDLERKTTRDVQYKQVEETLKEIQKGLQDCREKLARLEGGKGSAVPDFFGPPARSGNASSPKPATPTTPSEVKPAGGTTKPGTGKPGPANPDDE